MVTSSGSVHPALFEANGNLERDVGGDEFDSSAARKVERGERD